MLGGLVFKPSGLAFRGPHVKTAGGNHRHLRALGTIAETVAREKGCAGAGGRRVFQDTAIDAGKNEAANPQPVDRQMPQDRQIFQRCEVYDRRARNVEFLQADQRGQGGEVHDARIGQVDLAQINQLVSGVRSVTGVSESSSTSSLSSRDKGARLPTAVMAALRRCSPVSPAKVLYW